MGRYLLAAVDHYGELTACRMMRSHLGWFVKGLPCSAHFRESIKCLSSRQEAADLIAGYREFLLSVPEERRSDIA
jgi:tRNA-dihydrouridine synthase B